MAGFLLGVAWPIFKQTPFWKRLDATLWYILRDFPENMCMKFGLVSSFMTPTCPDTPKNHVSCVQKDVFQNTHIFCQPKRYGDGIMAKDDDEKQGISGTSR